MSDELVLRRGAQESLHQQIVAFLRGSILSGRLRRGSRMPSSRRLAAEQGVSRTTVVEAYERLEAEGYVVTRPRAGYFVADVLPEEFAACAPPRQARVAAAAPAPGVGQRPQAPRWNPRGDCLPLAPGIPALDHFPWAVWTRLSSQVLRHHGARAIAWPDPRGEPALREAVAEYLGTFRGIPCSAEQVIIANGSQPLVEILARVLAAPGDDVWFEEPGDPVARAVLSALGLNPVSVRVDGEGVDVEHGREIAASARLALVTSSHHYPLTVTMSMHRRRALLDWAAETGAWIIENEIDGDYRFSRRPLEPMYTLDDAARVIYLGSFNKVLAPGLRVGYAVLPPDVAEALPAMSPMVSVQQQLLLAQFWSSGHLAAHVRYLRQVHARRRAALFDALRAEAGGLLCVPDPPEAGLRVAAQLAPDGDDVAVVSACRSIGISLGRPLSQCYFAGPAHPGLTLGFASTPVAQIAPAVARVAEVIASRRRACA